METSAGPKTEEGKEEDAVPAIHLEGAALDSSNMPNVA